MILLKQSTAVTKVIGRFVDSTDGVTPETALTISQADVRLSKNGGAFAQKSDTGSCTHMEAGFYACSLNSTDTGTLGILTLAVNESGAAPVQHEYMVVPANVYDSLVGGSDYLQADVANWNNAALTGIDVYDAKFWIVDDNSGGADRWVVVWYKNSQPILAGITSPTLQVVKIADGTDLVASGAMTQVGSTGVYYKTEASNRIVSGAGYFAKAQATIDGATRTSIQPVGRDS